METLNYVACPSCSYTMPESEIVAFCPSCGSRFPGKSHSKNNTHKDSNFNSFGNNGDHRKQTHNGQSTGFSHDPNFHKVPPDFDYDYWANYADAANDDWTEKIVGIGVLVLAGYGIYRLVEGAKNKQITD